MPERRVDLQQALKVLPLSGAKIAVEQSSGGVLPPPRRHLLEKLFGLQELRDRRRRVPTIHGLRRLALEQIERRLDPLLIVRRVARRQQAVHRAKISHTFLLATTITLPGEKRLQLQ